MRSVGGWVGGEALASGCTGRKAGITGTLSALTNSPSPVQLLTGHMQANQVRGGSCRYCMELDIQGSRGIFGKT